MLIFFNKNWHSNSHVGCPKFCELPFACEVQFILMEKLNLKFEREMEPELFLPKHFLALV
jgi:hypothetical protein